MQFSIPLMHAVKAGTAGERPLPRLSSAVALCCRMTMAWGADGVYCSTPLMHAVRAALQVLVVLVGLLRDCLCHHTPCCWSDQGQCLNGEPVQLVQLYWQQPVLWPEGSAGTTHS